MSGPIQKYFRPGQYLFKEGDPSRSMYLISKGTVSVRKRKGSAFVELARLYSNEVIGELSFFDKAPRSASAVAITEVQVLEIPFEALDPVYKAFPEYIRAIMASVADRLRKADDTIRKLKRDTVLDTDEEKVETDPSEFQTAAAVLAATADIGFITKAGATEPASTAEESAEDADKPKDPDKK